MRTVQYRRGGRADRVESTSRGRGSGQLQIWGAVRKPPEAIIIIRALLYYCTRRGGVVGLGLGLGLGLGDGGQLGVRRQRLAGQASE